MWKWILAVYALSISISVVDSFLYTAWAVSIVSIQNTTIFNAIAQLPHIVELPYVIDAPRNLIR